jgi:head-tail adaptor
MIGAGKRDTPIVFERAVVGRDSLNEETLTWTPLQKAFAAVRYGTSAERREAAVTQSRQAATFRILATQALRGVTGKDRIVMRGQVWDIAGPPAEIGRVELEITAARAD